MRMSRVTVLPCVLLLFAVGHANADWNSVISADNPLHWFAFEEAEGATTADDQGSADVNGTFAGAVGLQVDGLVGKAASFDGASNVLVSGPNLVTDWTVEAIFQADTVNGGVSMGLLGADFAATTPRTALKAEQWNETEQLGYTAFGVVDETFAGDGAKSPAELSHVVFVGTGSGVELFVNGASVATGATSAELSRFVIGAGAVREDGTLVDGLTGVIDDLVIYDRALSAGDVSAHYAAIPEPASVSLALLGLLGLLRFRRR